MLEKKIKYPRLNFRIVHCSDQDPQYPSSQLLLQSPECKGWQTSRYCNYPVILVIQFVEPMNLKHIIMLSHQNKIASRVEIQYRLQKEKQYKRLGHFSFSTNQQSNFSVRELKNVPVDIICLQIKFSFMRNHFNKFNIFNQIGLINVGLFGNNLISNTPPNGNQNVQEFDKFTLAKLRELEIAKLQAIEKQDFDQAKSIKLQIQHYKKIGGKLAELQQKKKIAIQKEDFDTAKQIQQQIRKLKDINGDRPNFPNISQLPAISRMSVQSEIQNYSRNEIPIKKLLKKNNHDKTQQQQQKNLLEVSRTQLINNSKQIEQEKKNNQRIKQISSLKKKAMSQQKRYKPNNHQQLSLEGSSNSQQSETQSLAPEFIRLYNNYKDVYDIKTIKKVFSNKIQKKKIGLQEIKKLLISKPKNGDKKKLIEATLIIVKYFLQDKIADVISSALALFQNLLKKQRPSYNEANADLEYILNILAEYQGHPNDKIRAACVQLFLQLPRYGMTNKRLCYKALLNQKKQISSPKIIRGRLEMLNKLITQFKAQENYPEITQFAVKYLDHKNNEIRNEALELIKNIIKQIGYNKIYPFIKNVRNPTKKLIQQSLEIQQKSPQLKKNKSTNNNNNNGKQKKNQTLDVIPISDIQKNFLSRKSNVTLEQKSVNQSPSGGNGGGGGQESHKCQYCDLQDDRFKSQTFTDLHLFNQCPMLLICSQCHQATQIKSYVYHLLVQCDNRHNYKKCPRCQQAIHQRAYMAHVRSKQCRVAKPLAEANRCPLCHEDIGRGLIGWKKHLVIQGCPKNQSRKVKR